MRRKQSVLLSEEERVSLSGVVKFGEQKARVITRCRILLLSDKNSKGKRDREIVEALGVSAATVFNVRKRYCQEGIRAIHDKPRPGQPSKLSGKAAAQITALACSSPPEGRTRWTLELLADRAVELKMVESICPQSVHNLLKKTSLSRT